MATGDVLLKYAASSNLTVTALQSLAASQSWVAGWESDAIDNTTLGYSDYRVTAKITVGAANLQAGEIRLYLVGPLDDTTWPDVFDGTQSAETITDTEMRDAICRLGAASATDTGVSDVYFLDCPSVAAVFGGTVPKKFVVFITHSAHTTTAAIAATGQQVTVTGSYVQIAA